MPDKNKPDITRPVNVRRVCVNVNKSTCMRFGPRFDRKCANLITMSGHVLECISVCRYLGAFFKSARTFKFSWDNCKVTFYRSFDAVFGRLGCNASCELIVHLLSLKCVPVLLHGLQVCTINNSEIRTPQHPVNNALMKIFSTKSKDVVHERQTAFGFRTVRQEVYICAN